MSDQPRNETDPQPQGSEPGHHPPQEPVREREVIVTDSGGQGTAGVVIGVIVAIVAIVVLLMVFLGGADDGDGSPIPDDLDVELELDDGADGDDAGGTEDGGDAGNGDGEDG